MAMEPMRSKRVRRTRRLAAVTTLLAGGLLPVVAGPQALAVGKLCGVPADTVPPAITSVSYSADPIDVTNAPVTLAVTVHATDTSGNGAPSGVKHVQTDFVIHHESRRAHLTLTSGTATDGDWTGSVTIPTSVRSGTLRLEYLRVNDATPNYQFYDEGNNSPTGLALHPDWDPTIAVTSAATKPPRQHAGHLTDFSLTPDAVNTTKHKAHVAASATFSGPPPDYVRLLVVGKRVGHHEWGDATILRQSAPGAAFTGTIHVPTWAGTGRARVRQLAVGYPANIHPHFISITAAALHRANLTDHLAITSKLDHTAPVLRGLTPSTTSLDTTGGGQPITFTARVADRQSGVHSVEVRLEAHHGGRGSYEDFHLHAHGKKWSGAVTIPQCAASGTWKIFVALRDSAGNDRFYKPAELQSAGITSQISVTAAPTIDGKQPTAKNQTASGAAHTITVDFSEGVKNVTQQTLLVYATQPSATAYDAPLSVSSIVCDDATQVVDCDGSDGLVHSATLTASAVTGGGSYTLWANQNAVTPQLTDGVGNPAYWVGEFGDVTAA